MKIEWWCEPLGLGWVDICVTFGKRGARWTVPNDLTAQERELVLKSMYQDAHAIPLAVVRAKPAEMLVFPAPPEFEQGGIELDIFYPQGLFSFEEKPRDKRKPHPSKGPRGRWGNVE